MLKALRLLLDFKIIIWSCKIKITLDNEDITNFIQAVDSCLDEICRMEINGENFTNFEVYFCNEMLEAKYALIENRNRQLLLG